MLKIINIKRDVLIWKNWEFCACLKRVTDKCSFCIMNVSSHHKLNCKYNANTAYDENLGQTQILV